MQHVLARMLFFRLFLPSLALTLCSLGVAGYLENQRLTEQQLRLAHTLVHETELKLNEAQETLNSLACAAETTPPKIFTHYLKSAQLSWPYFETIYQLDSSCRILQQVPSNSPNQPSTENLPYCQNPESSLYPLMNSIRTLHPIIYLTAPIGCAATTDSTRGKLIVELNIDQFNKTLAVDLNIAPESAFIVDENGKLLAGEPYGYPITAADLKKLPIVQQGLQQDETSLHYWDSGQLMKSSAVHIPATGWLVIIQGDSQTVYGPTVTAFQLILLLSPTIWLILGLALQKKLHEHIISPLAQLGQKTYDLTAGKYTESKNESQPPMGIKEIETLTLNFHQMSRAIQRRQEALQTSEERYRQRSAQLETLRQIELELTAQLDLDALLNSIVTRSRELFSARDGALFLYNSEQETLEWSVVIGPTAQLSHISPRKGEGLIGKIWQTGTPLLINNYPTWQEGSSPIPDGFPLVATLGAPIYWSGQFLGILLINDTVPNRFTREDLELLNLLANQAAIAIHNAQTLIEEATQRRRAEALAQVTAALTTTLELQPLMKNVLQAAQKAITAAEYGSIILMNEKTGKLEIKVLSGYEFSPNTTIPTHYPPLRYCLEQGPLQIQDTQELVSCEELFPLLQTIQSAIMAPMHYRNQIIGIFLLTNPHRKNAFTQADLTLLTAFADQTAIAVANAGLYHNIELERSRLSTLYEATRLLSNAPTLDEAIHIIIQQIHYVGAESCDLILNNLNGQPALRSTNSERNTLTPQQTQTYIQEITSHGLQAWVMDQRRSARIDDTRQDPRWLIPLNSPNLTTIRSALCIPLIDRHNQILGFLCYSHSSPHAFGAAEQQLAEEIGARVSIAIENASLYDEARRRLAREKKVNDLAHTLSGEIELSQLIAQLLQGITRLTNADAATLALIDRERQEYYYPHHYNLTLPSPYREPLDHSLIAVAPTLKEPFQIPDYSQIQPQPQLNLWAQAEINTVLFLPLIVGDEILGTLGLFTIERPRRFPPEIILAGQEVARLAAVAIQRAQLFTAERESQQVSEALATAALAISSTLDLEQVLDRILEQVAQVVPGEAFNIMLLTQENIAEIMRRRDRDQNTATIPIAQSMNLNHYPTLRNMIRSGNPIVIFDTEAEVNWIRTSDRTWLRAYIGAPIRFKDRTIGFLNVNGSRPGQFTQADAQRLAAFASQVATALENARLFRELQDRAEHLEQLVQERTAQIQTQYARLETILGSTSDGIIVANSRGELLQVNPIVQLWLTQTLSPDDAAKLRSAIRELAPQGAQHPQTMVELKGLDLELNVAPISGPGLENDAVVIAVHDISHLKALDRVKSSLLSNVSHELRTPVTSIQLYTSLLRRGKREKWEEYLDALEKETSRQARLIEDVLQISRIDAGRLEISPRPTSLNELAHAVLQSHQVLAQNQKITLQTSLAPYLQPVYIDPDRIMQVFNNLVENALHHTLPGGEVTINTGTAETKGRNWAVLTVSDTGFGIQPEEIEHIFERFYRGSEPQSRQIPGTGLGLSIVKEIVELHGGWITVCSEVGEGSQFTVGIPFAE